MFIQLKKKLYFPIASYFKFWATMQLAKWHPRIIVVTGSSGKTTLLHLIASQLKGDVHFSHKANSSYGIPFDILGLHRKDLTIIEWPKLFFLAPLNAFKKIHREPLYVVEVDSDRPGEALFLAKLLHPEVVIWLSAGKTHSMNFDAIAKREGKSVEEAIAFEFGYMVEYCKRLAIISGDNPNISKQIDRTKAKIIEISINKLRKYSVDVQKTSFENNRDSYEIRGLLPKEAYYAIEAIKLLLDDLDLPMDRTFKHFVSPPGRASSFKGIKNTTLIDSTYNTNLDSMQAILIFFAEYPVKKKWMVLGDMLEQGETEKEQHEELACLALKPNAERIILMGKRVVQFTYPALKKIIPRHVELVAFEKPTEVLSYLESNIKGGETILFKGARFLEGVIEHLLLNKEDVTKLSRREKVWDIRRKQWGL